MITEESFKNLNDDLCFKNIFCHEHILKDFID